MRKGGALINYDVAKYITMKSNIVTLVIFIIIILGVNRLAIRRGLRVPLVSTILWAVAVYFSILESSAEEGLLYFFKTDCTSSIITSVFNILISIASGLTIGNVLKEGKILSFIVPLVVVSAYLRF